MANKASVQRYQVSLPPENVRLLREVYSEGTDAGAILRYLNHAATGYDPCHEVDVLPHFFDWEVYVPDTGSYRRVVEKELYPELYDLYERLNALGETGVISKVSDYIEAKKGQRLSDAAVWKIIRNYRDNLRSPKK